MKKIKYILLVFLVLFTINVKADDTCDSKEKTRLKELAKKVEFDYEFNEASKDFSIKAVNLSRDLLVAIINDYYSLDMDRFSESNGGILTGFKSGEKVIITIKGFVPNGCSGKTLLTKTIKLPYYNSFYDEERCRGNEDFKYCKQLISSDIRKSEFERQFAQYLKNKENNVKGEEEEPEKNSNIPIIAGSVVLVLIIISAVVMIINKRRKKNEL